mgnify:CR=1 FL=1
MEVPEIELLVRGVRVLVGEADAEVIRSSIDGAVLSCSGGRTITVLHLAGEGLFMRTGGPNGMSLVPTHTRGMNDHGVATSVHIDQDVYGTPLTQVMSGRATPSQLGGFLLALRAKGETVDEMAGCVQAIREHVSVVLPRARDLVDIVGTGGDGANTVNLSTMAAIVVAACGVMGNGTPYADLGIRKMAGNYGPDKKMATAIAAPTPSPANPFSEIGVSITRRSPNRSRSPRETL